jgi:hypothetical protein
MLVVRVQCPDGINEVCGYACNRERFSNERMVHRRESRSEVEKNNSTTRGFHRNLLCCSVDINEIQKHLSSWYKAPLHAGNIVGNTSFKRSTHIHKVLLKQKQIIHS